jgi:hypothetical protein
MCLVHSRGPRALEAAAALGRPVDEATLAELYPLLTAAQDAIGELAEALERRAAS